MVAVWIVLGVVVLLVLAALISYNRFVSQRQYLRNAWANVDTELRRRYDLIPNLVETVKGYATHEQNTLESVIRARTRAVANHGDPEAQAADENVLVDALRHLLALQEDYPDLKANESFLELQRELVSTEDRIQAARRFFNNNVRDYNRRVQSIPSTFVARLTGFHEEQYFEIEAAVREAPTSSFDEIA
ncbi:MAG: LemA family protein [Acidimicrobiia bacterium]|nr:LemA family protein [Acidimicrobiia bacterium]